MKAALSGAEYNPDGRQGYPEGTGRARIARSGIERNPWNLNRFRPAEGARRSCLVFPARTRKVRAAGETLP